METPAPSGPAPKPRRIVDKDRRMLVGDRNPNMWQIFDLIPTLQDHMGVMLAGRMVMFEDLVATDQLDGGGVTLTRIEVQFKLQHFFFPVWCVTSRGEDSEGPYEKGFNVYYYAFIPIPHSWTVGNEAPVTDGIVKFVQDMVMTEEGIRLVPMSSPMAAQMSDSDSWSDPVRLRLNTDTGELEVRAMRNPMRGEAIGLPEEAWLDT